MIDFKIGDILALPRVKGVNTKGIEQHPVSAISTDTRSIKKGEVYLALRGQQYDGHNYIRAAFANGAIACIVNQQWYNENKTVYTGHVCLTVPDTLVWYGVIANAYRNKFDLTVIGITGSNGKTTTKELVCRVLETKYVVHATSGNYNNQIGVPASLLQLKPDHEIAVIEMGTNQSGDIKELCKIARPDYGVITNISRSHLERLLTVSRVANEKLDLYRALPHGGIAFVNADDPYMRKFSDDRLVKITFGYHESADIRIMQSVLDKTATPIVKFHAPGLGKKEFQIHLNTAGLHSAYAAAIALAIGGKMGCAVYKMKKAIQHFVAPGKRMQVCVYGGVTIVDDSYNANPDSVIAAIDTLAAMKIEGKKIVVLGDMLELGENSRALHAEVGTYIEKRGILTVMTFGTYSEHISQSVNAAPSMSKHYVDKRSLIADLLSILEPGDAVLVKGSRAMDMSSVVTAIVQRLEQKRV